jgi:hypothetical protein
MTRTEPIITTTTMKTDRHHLRRTLALVVALAALAAALAAMAFAAGDAQAKKGKPPASTPGHVIAFTSNRDGNQEIYTMNADGSNLQRLTKDDTNAFDRYPTWSPNGERDSLREQPGRQLRDLHDVRHRLRPGEPHQQSGARFRSGLFPRRHRHERHINDSLRDQTDRQRRDLLHG